MRKKVIMIFLILMVSVVASLAEHVVIVNPGNSTADLPKAMLKRLFTGRVKELGGVKAVPINQNYSNGITAEFLNSVVEKSPEEYKEFWVAQQIKGLGSAPMIQANDAGVVNMVASIPGAIGYVDAASVTDAVKVITIK